jgi:signal transduction histidine kinase
VAVLMAAVLLVAGASPDPSTASVAPSAPPRTTSVSPSPVVGSTDEQWLTIRGRGFSKAFTVRLRGPGTDALIEDRAALDFVNARQVRVRATLGTEAATWTARVLGLDGTPSAAHRFSVVAPKPKINVMGPVERPTEGSSFTLSLYGSTLTSYSEVRLNGTPLETTPITSSDNPNALTVGLKARVPAEAVTGAGRYEARVHTPPPGGGRSNPRTLFVNPRSFYRTPWFYLALVALLAAVGAGVHRWRLKNLRERELKRKVEQRTAELRWEKEKTERQAAELRTLDDAKNRFFANVSHELRTPPTTITGPLRDLLASKDGALSDDTRETIRVAARSAERLDILIERLLDLSRLEAGRLSLEPRPGELVAFARDETRAFAPLAERRGLDLRFQAGPQQLPLRFDPEKLRTILRNLLSNALKFTPEGGKVVVRVDEEQAAPEGEPGQERQERKDGPRAAVVRVCDTGLGIPPDELPHVFERFHQADDSAARSQQGLGIGLAMARQMAELHGGTLRAESEPGLGATLVLILPVRAAPLPDGQTGAPPEAGDAARLLPPSPLSGNAPAPPESPDTAAPSDEAPARDGNAAPPVVLIAEDDADTRAFLRRQLAGDYRIVEARDGAEALEQVRDERPAVVVSDVMMPEMDGATLCRRLKADDALRDVPILLLTAQVGEAAQVDALDAGAQYRGEVVIEPTGVTVPSEENAFYEKARAVVEDHIGDAAFDVGMFAAEMGAGVQTKRQLRDRLKGDAEYFSKRFREHHGVPPSQYPLEDRGDEQ